MKKFPDCPIPDNMHRKSRMNRLYKKLIDDALYVRPVCLDDKHSEYGYFIVSVDDPYSLTKQID